MSVGGAECEAPARASSSRNVGRSLLELGADAPALEAVVAYGRTRGAVRERPPIERADLRTVSERARRIAIALSDAGLEPGARVSLFVRPSVDLIAVTWGLFLAGMVPVFVDPGLPRATLLAAIERTRPAALVGVREAQLARRLFPRAFASVRLFVQVGSRLPGLGKPLDELCARVDRRQLDRFEPHAVRGDSPAAILFTSGSTGPPKGVLHTHDSLAAQAAALQRLFRFERGERDLAALPAFALFAPALGLTAVLPDLDPRRGAVGAGSASRRCVACSSPARPSRRRSSARCARCCQAARTSGRPTARRRPCLSRASRGPSCSRSRTSGSRRVAEPASACPTRPPRSSWSASRTG